MAECNVSFKNEEKSKAWWHIPQGDSTKKTVHRRISDEGLYDFSWSYREIQSLTNKQRKEKKIILFYFCILLNSYMDS